MRVHQHGRNQERKWRRHDEDGSSICKKLNKLDIILPPQQPWPPCMSTSMGGTRRGRADYAMKKDPRSERDGKPIGKSHAATQSAKGSRAPWTGAPSTHLAGDTTGETTRPPGAPREITRALGRRDPPRPGQSHPPQGSRAGNTTGSPPCGDQGERAEEGQTGTRTQLK